MLLGSAASLNQWLDACRELQGNNSGSGADTLQKLIVFEAALSPEQRLELKMKLKQAGTPEAEALQCYGRPEMRALFFECREGTGIHLNPQHFFWEVLDAKSREPVKWGEPGVLVFSHVDWRGTVLLRYWTGDMVEGGVYWERCPGCGLTLPVAHGPLKDIGPPEQ